MPVTTSLLSLPIDVLFVIRDVISSAPFTSIDPGLGLLAHLSLSQTCRRLHDIYTFSTRESDDLFWKRACAMAGYGRPMRREYPQALPGVAPFRTNLPPKCSPGSRLRSSSLRTHVYVRSVVAGTPVAGPMTWIRGPRRSRSTRCFITSTSRQARSSTPRMCCTRCSRRIRIAGERFTRRSVAMRALRAPS